MTPAMSKPTILVDVADGVRTITLNRPERRNAFNEEMYQALARCLREAALDRATRVIVLTGAGVAFSAGQDISEMSLAPPPGDTAATPTERGFPALLDVLIESDKPIFAAVNGLGLGIGLTILLHCDCAWIARGARLRAPFTTLGVVPEAASSLRLPQRIGYMRAAEILFSARWIEAEEAARIGLCLEVVAPEDLAAVVRAHALEIARRPPGSVRHTKQLLKVWQSTAIREALGREAEAFQTRLRSAENAEAIAAFFEKREPDFSRLPEE